mmetsp:Transcript_24607/g.61755  ORF Transcript_24607/g.61755 Transcript_24607/m.61755 type:complete len:287 (+) Transcript_24607:709-1569(+)
MPTCSSRTYMTSSILIFSCSASSSSFFLVSLSMISRRFFSISCRSCSASTMGMLESMVESPSMKWMMSGLSHSSSSSELSAPCSVFTRLSRDSSSSSSRLRFSPPGSSSSSSRGSCLTVVCSSSATTFFSSSDSFLLSSATCISLSLALALCTASRFSRYSQYSTSSACVGSCRLAVMDACSSSSCASVFPLKMACKSRPTALCTPSCVVGTVSLRMPASCRRFSMSSSSHTTSSACQKSRCSDVSKSWYMRMSWRSSSIWWRGRPTKIMYGSFSSISLPSMLRFM